MIKTNYNDHPRFFKENFKKDGDVLLYGIGDKFKFVARFKYSGPITMAKFRKELIANHAPKSYFEAKEGGKSPLEILKEANPIWYSQIMNRFAFSL